MIKTQQDQVDPALQTAMLHAAFSGEQDASLIQANAEKLREQTPSPLNGARLPAGRPPGVKNKVTNLRDAVLGAFDKVGGMEYLARLAEGTQSDRAAFVSLVSKVLPTQINANVEGGIQVQLSWLGQRSIGTTTAQAAEQVTQVVDLERDSSGKYRIKDQQPQADAGGSAAAEGAEGPRGA